MQIRNPIMSGADRTSSRTTGRLTSLAKALVCSKTIHWEAVVYFTVTYDGVPIGATELAGSGVRVGRLFVLPSYAACGLSQRARRLGVAFMAAHWSRVPASTAAR